MRNFIQVKKVHRRRGAKASRRLLRLYKSYFLLYHRFIIWQPLFRHIFAIIFIFLHFVNVTQTVCLFLTFPVILFFFPFVPHFFLLRDLRAQIFEHFARRRSTAFRIVLFLTFTPCKNAGPVLVRQDIMKNRQKNCISPCNRLKRNAPLASKGVRLYYNRIRSFLRNLFIAKYRSTDR